MDSVDTEVLRTAVKWIGQGHRPVLATIVRTWGSAPRPVGALLVIREDGQVVGSVSGGCVEDDLIDRYRSQGIAGKGPEVVTYGVTREQAERFGLPCGGTLQLVLEPLSAASGLEPLLAAVDRHELVARTLDIPSGRSTLAPAKRTDTLEFDGTTLRNVYGPTWRLLLIGAGQLTRYLAEMARALDYDVTVCDPREEYAAGWDVYGVRLDRGMPDDVVLAMNMDAHTAVIALTHDPKLDDMALLEALKSPAFYVGAIGSRANQAKRRRRLAQFDLAAAEIDRLHGPVGLHIGSRTPPEIAISILAEMTMVRRGVSYEAMQERKRLVPADSPVCE